MPVSPQNKSTLRLPSPLKRNEKPRPATATSLASSGTLQSLLSINTNTPSDEESARTLLKTTRRPPVAVSPLFETTKTSLRCAGCGAVADVCMACFSHFKKQDAAAYKKQLVRSVEILFEKATARAFDKMAHVISQWVFGSWKREWLQNKQRRLQVLQLSQRRFTSQFFQTWRHYVMQRRIVGAMLYAENQQHVTQSKTNEIKHLHGELFQLTHAAQIQDKISQEVLEKLQQTCEQQQQALQQKNQELIVLRKELLETKARVTELEKQAIDPKEVERIKNEAVDYKKAAFQVVTSVVQTMETQMEQLATSEGRQNLLNVFSKDVVQSLDRPEYAGFYNPLATTTNEAEPSLQSSYEAPVDRADKILLQWVNALLQRQPPEWLQAPKIFNFHSSLSDGRVLVVLSKILHAAMCRFRPKRPTGAVVPSKLEATSVLRENGEDLTEIAMERYVDHIKKEDTAEKRLELMLTTIGQALWMPLGLLNAKEIVAGDAEFNFAALSYLFCTFSPVQDDAFVATCNDLKLQISTVKAKWRDLRDGVTSAEDGAASLSMRMKLLVAQTMEVRRKLDLEDQKAREGHLLWFKSIRIVLRKCFVSYARLARGKAGVLSRLDASSDENEVFSKIPKAKIQDLELPYEDFQWEVKLLQSFLVTIYCDLARIYRGYAKRTNEQNDLMNMQDFVDLLTDCRILESNFTMADCQLIIKKVDPKAFASSQLNLHRALPPSEYLEALVRVARRKYAAETHRMTISEAFCLLVENFLLPFAFRADADLFRKQVEDSKIRRLFIKYADQVKELFAKYATEDTKKNGRKRLKMTTFAFSQCLLDKNIQDVHFNSEKIMTLVQKVVRHHKKHEMGDDALSYDAFEEALVAIACFKFPDPYISLESRLEKFLSVYLRDQSETTELKRPHRTSLSEL